jgi:hypothetical protein
MFICNFEVFRNDLLFCLGLFAFYYCCHNGNFNFPKVNFGVHKITHDQIVNCYTILKKSYKIRKCLKCHEFANGAGHDTQCKSRGVIH